MQVSIRNKRKNVYEIENGFIDHYEYRNKDNEIPCYSVVERYAMRNLLRKKILRGVNSLSARKKFIVVKYYGLDGNGCMSLGQIKDELKKQIFEIGYAKIMTGEGVRHQLYEAEKRLKKWLEKDNINSTITYFA